MQKIILVTENNYRKL